MAKKISDEVLKLEVVINGDSAKKELFELEQAQRKLRETNKALRQEKARLEAQNKKGSREWKQVTARIKENTTVIKQQDTRLSELRNQIGLTGLTMNQLKRRASELRLQLSNLTPGSAKFKQLEGELKQIDARLVKLRMSGRAAENALSRMANALNKYQALGASVLGAVLGIVFTLQSLTEGSAKLADAQADVQKTTQLSSEAVTSLTKDLQALNTRTPRLELLKLAEEAGRLGKTSKKDVLDFVETANMLKVALGDDLGDESAIRDVGKLTEQYKIGARYGRDFGDSMQMLGSAINEVSAKGSNQASFQVDYLKRMIGVSKQTRIAAQDQIGFAAALDESGQNVEASATAMSKIFVDMYEDTSTYARVAKMDFASFSKLLKEDANEAMLTFLEGLNGNNEGFEVMVDKLGDLEIGGTRAITVLSTLAGNTALVRTRQAQANQALEAGTSLTNEYNVKNENLAANLAKVQRALYGKFISSSLMDFLERTFSSLAKLTEKTETYGQKMRALRSEINMELETLKHGNFTQDERRRLISEINQSYGDYLPQLISERDTIEDITRLQKELNKEFETKILYKAFEEELAQAIKKTAQASEALYQNEKRRQELRQNANRGAVDLSASQLKFENELLDTFDAMNQEVVNHADKAKEEIEQKYTSIFARLGVDFEKFRASLRGGLGSTEGSPSGGDEKKELQTRKEAAERIRQFLLQQKGDEVAIIREKYKEMLELAKENKISTVALQKALDAELAAYHRIKQDELLGELLEFERQKHELRKQYGTYSEQELFELEIEQLELNLHDKLLTEKEYLIALERLKDEHAKRQQRKAEEQADKERQRISEWINTRSEVATAAGELVSNLKEIELQNISEVTQRKGESEESFTLRKEKQEQERYKIAKKYAFLEATIRIAQVVGTTAEAIMKALALPIPPPVPQILAGTYAAVGATQVGVAIAQASKIKSYNRGLYPALDLVLDQNGITYAAENNEELPTGIYDRPTVSYRKNMLVGEKAPELVVDPITTKRLARFNPEVLQTIYRTANRVESYNKGNYPSLSRQEQTRVDMTTTNTLLEALVNQNSVLLEKLGRPSIAVLQEKTRRDLQAIGELEQTIFEESKINA
jgi:hypothetical protein